MMCFGCGLAPAKTRRVPSPVIDGKKEMMRAYRGSNVRPTLLDSL